MLKRLHLPRGPQEGPIVAAHRGAMTVAPENTIAAFEVAVEQGAAMIELDVHPTRDGELAVLHDVTTGRTTSRDVAVQDMTLDQVTSLDAGAWFDASYSGQTIPSLQQVLHWARSRAYLCIDVRNYPFIPFYRGEGTAETILTLLDDTNMLRNVVLQCLDHVLARNIRQLCPDVHVGITQHGRPLHVADLAASAGATLVGLDSAFLTSSMVDTLHEAGAAVMTSIELRLPGMHKDAGSTDEVTTKLLEMDVDIIVSDEVPAITRQLNKLQRSLS